MSIEPAPGNRQVALPRVRLSFVGLLSAGGFLVCLFSVTGFAGRMGWLFEITSHFRVQYAAILGIVALLFLWQRKHRTSSVFLAFAFLNVWMISPFLFGAHESYPPTKGRLRLLSWNVNSGNREFGELTRLLEQQKPDVVLLMEVDTGWAAFLRGTMTNYSNQHIVPRDDNFGIALFSNVPLDDMRTLYLGEAGLPSISAEVSTGGRVITLLGTHPLPPAGGLRTHYRDDQLRAAALWARHQANQVVVAGDLNTSPWSPAFEDLLKASGLSNSSEGRGLNGSWPAFFPPMLIPIDHFLVSKNVEVMHREIVKAGGSDHLPQVVEFGIR